MAFLHLFGLPPQWYLSQLNQNDMNNEEIDSLKLQEEIVGIFG